MISLCRCSRVATQKVTSPMNDEGCATVTSLHLRWVFLYRFLVTISAPFFLLRFCYVLSFLWCFCFFVGWLEKLVKGFTIGSYRWLERALKVWPVDSGLKVYELNSCRFRAPWRLVLGGYGRWRVELCRWGCCSVMRVLKGEEVIGLWWVVIRWRIDGGSVIGGEKNWREIEGDGGWRRWKKVEDECGNEKAPASERQRLAFIDFPKSHSTSSSSVKHFSWIVIVRSLLRFS